MADNVNQPKHYTSHPSGIECIHIARALPFGLGNAYKYVFRRNDKDDLIENLRKAAWYLRDARDNYFAAPFAGSIDVHTASFVADHEPYPFHAIMRGIIAAAQAKHTDFQLLIGGTIGLLEAEIKRLEVEADITAVAQADA